MDFGPLWEELAREDGGTIVYLVLDGIGGLSGPAAGGTALQRAETPNLDGQARVASCGLLEIVGPGITPGSGPGHLALFGYDPVEHAVGRGVLSALGVDFPLREGDVAARVNFATLDGEGRVADRRAGRLATGENRRLVGLLREGLELDLDGELFLETVAEHRAVLVLRGDGLGGGVGDTDPQRTGARPREARAHDEGSRTTAALVREIDAQAREILAGERANGVLLRGFDRHRRWRGLHERFRLRGLCLADYPMYRGVSRLLGMELAEPPGGLEARFDALAERQGDGHDLYFLHVKQTDSRGEDGDLDAKVRAIEEVDRLLPRLLQRPPDVLVVTGDHSTPASMGAHSWHPVPVMIRADHALADGVRTFDELACAGGVLGLRPARDLMGLALAHAGRLRKYGA